MVARSYLFVPGDRPEMLTKALHRGADAVIADLEDAVAPGRKGKARSIVSSWLLEQYSPDVELWTRVNPDHQMADDIAALQETSVTGILLPKLQGVGDIKKAVAMLDAVGLRSALVIPIIETAAAVLALESIAAAKRVLQLMIGEMDLGAQLGIHYTTAEAWAPIRLQLVVASAAAGIAAPIGPVDPNFKDPERLFAKTKELYRLGFRSRPAIHPAQVSVYNQAMSPTEEEIAAAHRVIEQFEAARSSERGTWTDDQGRMIDEAAVRAARAIIDAAARSVRKC